MREHEWLKIHCANHSIELAAKEVIINSKFVTVDNTYIIIFILFEKTRKINGIIQEKCKSKNVKHFTLSKITDTT